MMQNHPSSEDLFAYRDGELELEKRSLVEAHVLSCSACLTRLDDTSDAEGMLRQGLQDPSDAYFDRMTESVMGRVTGKAPVQAAAGTPARAGSVGGLKGATSEPRRARDAESREERAGRRSKFDDGPRSRAPGLPWPAILSAASAAAAVVVVVVMLVQRQDAWRHAPAPGGIGLEEKKKAGSLDEVAPEEQVAPAPTDASKEQPAEGGNAVGATKDELLAKSAPPPSAATPSVPSTVASDLSAASSAKNAPEVSQREEEIRTQSAADALPEGMEQKQGVDLGARVAALRARADAAAPPAGAPAGPGFAEVAGRYALPLVYDPARVPGSVLLRAEGDLRLLYQTGRAGEDSARVRLYLAEAARERGAGTFDAETFDTIVHHYRRAVALARDEETARMARKRLEDFVSKNAPQQ